MPPTRERGKYSKDLLHTAVQAVINGSKAPEVAKRHNIPIATLNKRVREQRSGQALVTKRRGPKPTLPDSCEEDLVAWIVAMQRDGNPTDRKTIIVKANQVLRRLDPTASLSAGWYRRFIVRHPQLTNRVAQVISSARNEVDDVAVTTLFNSLVNAIVTNKLSSDRVFNMDETSFASRRKSKDVIALKGSRNVWAKTVATNFHFSIVACGNASGYFLPPLFLLPGETVEKNIENYCSVPNATISTSPKGFMNEDLFEHWLKYFAKTVDKNIERPLLLVFDGLSSHFSLEIVELCKTLQVELLCLPSNATHLFQPLDVAVFGPYKTSIRKEIFEDMVNDETGDFYTISKPTALRIASNAWKNCVLAKNIISGFQCTGLFPASLVKMRSRYRLFKDGGVPKTTLLAPWIERREVIRREVLCLPAKEKKKRGIRSTVDVARRILTLGLLHEVDTTRKERLEATKQKKALQTKRAKKKPRREVKSCACGDHVVAKPQSTTGHAATELESVVVI
ncbi:hypothetical protein AaE_013989 [Aphanomyces astaci]|uniref:HTH CENPB-type domain-containing protein n=1 Tax=Aphanomyces astaci TaxID=112090 RepID=A0A6A4ZGV8_APHAT|nr:hypothetical protein AaE_013989 [Aphanomyces astaci]